MAAVLLPSTFHNSFWSNQDYFRTGLQVLMRKLQEGCDENMEIGVFIKAQAQHYRQLSRSLANETPALPLVSSSTQDSPSTLQTTLTTIQSSAVTAQAEHYARLADDLEFRVARDFERWSAAHRNRVMMASDEALGSGAKGDRGLVGRYEALGLEVAKMKQIYLGKARVADDLEEDARFAPHFPPQTQATPQSTVPPKTLTPVLPSSPRLASIKERAQPTSPTTNLRRAGTVAERINEKLRAATTLRRTPGGSHGGGSISSLKGIGEQMLSMSLADSKAIDTPTSGLPPSDAEQGGDYIMLAGLMMPVMKLFELLAQLQHYLATSLPPDVSSPVPTERSEAEQVSSNGKADEEKAGMLASGAAGVDPNREGDGALRSRTRMTVLGSYDCCLSGAELREWLLRHVEGFGNDPARGSEAGAALVKWGLVGRIGVGRGWQDDEETFYHLKDAAFDTSPFAIESLKNHIRASEPASKTSAPSAPTTSATSLPSLSTAGSLVKSYLPALTSLPNALTASSDGEAPHIKARKEAKIADEEYRAGVDELEMMRLRVEEWVEKGLKSWERWERERMGSVKTVLGQYHLTVSTLPGRMQAWTDDVKVAVEAFKPDVDFRAMIENNRIGNFRPTPHIYESLDSEIPEVSFGIDLRKWAGSNWKSILRDSGNEKPNGSGAGSVPPAFMALLKGLQMKYPEVSDDLRRKSWIFLVDLRETHELRERLNDPLVPLADMLDEVAKFNAPVIAATVKLWLLELNPPVCGYDAYEACKSLYAKRNDVPSNDRVPSALSEIMGRLSGVQIMVLDTLFAHLQDLVRGTKTDEEDSVYLSKLALSLGRVILRPATESAVTLQDRTPSRLFTDLFHHHSEIFPPLVERAQKALDRPMPVRKRTRPVDQRISRSRLSESGEDGVLLLKNLQATPVSAVEEKPFEEGVEERRASIPRDDAEGVREGMKESENVSPTDDVLGDYTRDDDHTPTAERPASPAPAPITEPERTPAPAHEPPRPATPPARRRSVEEDAPVTPVAVGVRLSRARPMSVHREKFGDDAVLADGETSLQRAGSGEARAVRGPRGARGPRPGPGKLGSVDLTSSPGGARPGSPSIKDRIAHLESRGGDRSPVIRFVAQPIVSWWSTTPGDMPAHSEYGTYNDHDPRPQAPLHLHALPKGHGPASSSTRISTVYSLSSLEHAPTFVKAVGAYDELGRSLADGVDAGVITGKGKHEEGEGLKFWRNLDLGPSQVGSRASTPLVTPSPQHDTSAHRKAFASSSKTEPEIVVAPIAPIHVPREQWFIRRALLAKAEKERDTQSAEGSSSTAGASVPPTRPATPSLASLLDDSLPPPPTTSQGEDVEGYRPPAYFHLKPSNKGWRVLKNIGWDERGGLGRGLVDAGSEEERERVGVLVKSEDGVSGSSTAVRRVDGTEGTTNDSAIDLTLDSESDSDSDQPSAPSRPQAISPNHSPEPSSVRNPLPSGRTAPIATYLKTDLRGIGALSSIEKRRTLLRPGTLSAPESRGKRKRVTHTQEEIRAVARDARASGEGLVGEERVAWDKRRMKRDQKRDREDRQRWRAAIDL